MYIRMYMYIRIRWHNIIKYECSVEYKSGDKSLVSLKDKTHGELMNDDKVVITHPAVYLDHSSCA